MGYPPVVVVESGGVPRTQVAEGASAPAFTVVESGARAITLADNSPPIALFNPDGSHYMTAAARLLAGAQNPLGDLAAVMASPPTITDPLSDGANSTIQTAQGVNAGLFSPTDASRVTIFGGKPLSSGRIQTITRQAGSRIQGHSACIAFYTDAQTVDFSLRCNGARWIAYVTEPDGTRARIAAADRAGAFANYNYYKLDFGSPAAEGRLVEVYTDLAANYGGINVPDGYTIWAATLQNQPRIAAVWDSFGEGSINDSTKKLKLATLDHFAARFGVHNPFVNAVGSTGVIADAGASNYNTYQERLDADDLAVSRVGAFDLIFAPGSVNDGNTSVNGLAVPAGDATVQAAYQAFIAALMVEQPSAIIVGCSQQFSSSAAAAASRVAAYKAGFEAAAGSASRMIWLDGSIFESAPGVGVIGADNVHPSLSGAQTIGESLANQIIAVL